MGEGQEGETAEWERANPMHDVEGKAAVVWKKHFLRWAAAFPKEVVVWYWLEIFGVEDV